MKSIKKLKKYGTAIAGSALLVGATLTGAAATSHGGSSGMNGDLSDYPAPFVDDDGNVQSSIVVGDDAATADVVGAIDIAGSLSQAAYTSEEVEGTSSESVDGSSNEVAVGASGASDSISPSDYDGLTRDTVEDDDGDDVFVTESASYNSVNSVVNGTTVQTNVADGSVAYTASFTPGFAANDTVSMLGNDFEITSVDSGSDVVDLGSTESASGLSVGDSYEHGPYTVTVEGGNSNGGAEILVNVMMDGDQVESGQLSSGDTLNVEDDFDLTANTVFYDSGSESWSIALESTYTDTTLEKGETFALDEDYDVNDLSFRTVNGVDHLTSVELTSNVQTVADPDDDEMGRLEAGQSFAGPTDAFSLTNQGLTNQATTPVEFGQDSQVTFTGINAQEQSFQMNQMAAGAAISGDTEEETVYGVKGPDATDDSNAEYYPVALQSVSDDNTAVTVSHNGIDYEFGQSSGTEVTSGSASWYETVDGTTLSASDSVTYQRIDTGYGFEVVVEWVDSGDDGSYDTVNVASGVDYTAPNDDAATDSNTGAEAATQVTTQYGSSLAFADDNTGTYGTGSGYDVVQHNEAYGDQDSTGNGVTVDVVYEDIDGNSAEDFSDVDSGEVAKVGTGGTVLAEDTGDSTLSTFGSAVEYDSATSATVTYPDEQRKHNLALGSVSSDSSEGGMSMSPTYGDTFPSMGALDTAENIGQVKENDNVIVVGGPAINDLTAELADENQTWDANEWQTGGHEGESVLQMVDGWNEDHSALVVAGHSAEDTTTAADFLANYGDHSEALSGTDQVTISTETGNVVQ
ncbi:hypothetical protein AQV86_00140 [Nanohaloarchaea archaeon SG9]|nr:hypothetical protein AQV86_00140 [Nanohaloarchaea archaeon SG9]